MVTTKMKTKASEVVAKQEAELMAAEKEKEKKEVEEQLLKTQKELNKMTCKVELLTAMVAMKDEVNKTTEERFTALKWEVLNNFQCDDEKLSQVKRELRDAVHGYDIPIMQGTETIAPLVVMRQNEIKKLLQDRRMIPVSDFVDLVATSCLPEFRRDFLTKVFQHFGNGSDIDAHAFLKTCEDAFVDALRKYVRQYPKQRLSRAASKTLQATQPDHTEASAAQQQQPQQKTDPTPVSKSIPSSLAVAPSAATQESPRQQRQPTVISTESSNTPISPPEEKTTDDTNLPPSSISAPTSAEEQLQEQLKQQQALMEKQAADLQHMQIQQQKLLDQQVTSQQDQKDINKASSTKKKSRFSWVGPKKK